MSNNVPNATRPFDPTGRLPGNLIAGDQQTLSGNSFRDIYTVVPRLAPYFETSLQVSFRPNNSNEIRPLVNGVDFQPSHQFISASRACATPIFGSVTILDLSLRGVVTLSYQTIGGVWTTDYQTIAQILADHIHNPRRTSWEQVVNLPYRFPVVDHEWDLVDMVGASEVIEAIHGTELAIRDATSVQVTQRLNDLTARVIALENRLTTAGIP